MIRLSLDFYNTSETFVSIEKDYALPRSFGKSTIEKFEKRIDSILLKNNVDESVGYDLEFQIIKDNAVVQDGIDSVRKLESVYREFKA